MLEPVAVSSGPHYGTLGEFRPPGAMGTHWYSMLLAWECGMASCIADAKGKRHA